VRYYELFRAQAGSWKTQFDERAGGVVRFIRTHSSSHALS